MAALKLTPLVKGLIAGILMIGINLALISSGNAEHPAVAYVFYILYASAITWTLLGYYRSADYVPKFGAIFNQGFRCFIIITLIHVIFTGAYAKMHPELAEQAAQHYVEDMMKKPKDEKSRTPEEIKQDAEYIRKNFVTANIWGAIFGTLITGAVFTAAGAGLLLMRRT